MEEKSNDKFFAYNREYWESIKNAINILDYFFIFEIILCLIISIWGICIIYINENQILYLFSTGAQVVSGLFGLTLAGYTYLNSRLEKAVSEDDTLYDATEELKNKYFNLIIKIGIICALSIALSLLNIAICYTSQISQKVDIFIINLATIFVLNEVVNIVKFTIEVTNPNKITNISDQLNPEKSKNQKGDLAEFLKYYNSLEFKILDFYDKLTSSEDELKYLKFKNRKGYRPQILQALNVLIYKEIIDTNEKNHIDEIRKYRNYVVHGKEPFVTKDKCKEIKVIYEDITNKISEYKNTILSITDDIL